MTKPAPNLGSVIVHDPRLNIDRHFPVTKVELRSQGLYIEASGTVTVGGTIDGEVSLRAPDGTTMLPAHWHLSFRHLVEPGETFTVSFTIPLGGDRSALAHGGTINLPL